MAVIKSGASSDELTVDPTSKAARVTLYDAAGNIVTLPGLASNLMERITNTDGASTALSTFGATASQRNYITGVIACNAHATTYGTVDLRDGTGGAVLATIPLPPASGAMIVFPTPLRQPTTNTALAYDVSAAITTITLTFFGFKSAQ